MTTKLTAPQYSPEVASRVTLVNCCVTEQGFQEQLLDIVISKLIYYSTFSENIL
jgi:dynein heavy chain